MLQPCSRSCGFSVIVPLKEIEYGVYGDPMLMYPKPYSIYLRGPIGFTSKA